MNYQILKKNYALSDVKCRIETPTVLFGKERDSVNRFVADFVGAFERALGDLDADDTLSSVDLRAACRECGDLFSVHFSAEFSRYDAPADVYYRSFVFDMQNGTLVLLSDVTDREFADQHKGWSFYIGDRGVTAYHVDKDGRTIKRETGKLALRE